MEMDILEVNIVPFIKRVENIHEEVDFWMPSLVLDVACKKGCHFCCYFPSDKPLMSTLIEASLIASYLNSLNDNRDSWAEHLVIFNGHYELAMERSYPSFPVACPFTEDKSCSVYPVRPLLCRLYISESQNVCMTGEQTALMQSGKLKYTLEKKRREILRIDGELRDLLHPKEPSIPDYKRVNILSGPLGRWFHVENGERYFRPPHRS
ncbi:MAG: YkgJ family cysteine cluster protein [Nitrospinae bacterium]|nr:YkgJ family cysteine cluster protein [Nitrospinota bacterium]